jgi:hypothetical protein
MIANAHEKRLIRHIGHPLLYQNPPRTKYNIWLPSAFPQDHADETALGKTTMNDYKEFDHLIHATHIKMAIDVAEDQKLRGMPVEGWSEIQEMLPCKKFTWTAPDTALDNPCRYGPAVLHFCMNGYEVRKCYCNRTSCQCASNLLATFTFFFLRIFYDGRSVVTGVIIG